jgi:hypothetical protein
MAVGGLFRSNLLENCCESLESPQRQLGDCSDPTYWKTARETLKSPQRQLGDGSDPTSETKRSKRSQKRFSYMHLLWERRPDLNNPPTPVGGILRIQKGITLVGWI